MWIFICAKVGGRVKKRQLIWITLSVFFISLIMGFAPVQPVQADTEPIIVTIAGNGTPGYTGNGGAAVKAQLNYPRAIVFDKQGNMYIADTSNNCVRKIDTQGIITTYAGCGIRGTSGDGGPAVLAQLMSPRALAVDQEGNLYIATSFNLRKVDTKGNISTVAGTSEYGFSGIGGAATAAQFYSINSVVVDNKNNMFISESGCIYRVNTKGIINPYAGNGGFGDKGDGGPANLATFFGANGLTLDSNNNLYFADIFNSSIRKIDSNGIISTVAGAGEPFQGGYSGDGGPATSAELDFPNGLAFDKAGNMYIADTGNNCIRKVDTTGTITTVVGKGVRGFSGNGRTARFALLSSPNAIAFDAAGNMYIADGSNHCIRKVILNESDMKNIIVDNTGVVLKIGSSKMLVGDEEKDIDPGYATAPEIVNDRTFVPIKAIIENLGGTVEWNETEQKITIKVNNVEAVVQIGNTYSTINGVYKKLDDKPYLSSTGRAMLPVKCICENLGFEVVWDSSNSTVTIR